MNVIEYQALARRTMKELPREQHFVHMALGIVGEMGEFVDAVKKHVIYGKPLDLVNLSEETGDDFWYAAGLLPELGVSHEAMQRSIQEGYSQGVNLASHDGITPWILAGHLLAINLAIATIACVLTNEQERFPQGSSDCVKVIESLGGLLGSLCGLFGLDPYEAMSLNIKKLAKRYGDKYSDMAALNRDLVAERAVLEGGQ